MKNFYLFTLALCMSIAMYGQTYVSGGIFGNTTWTKANSPYIVSGTLVVFDELTLTIEPGVHVLFDGGAELELRNSRLVAIGTASDSIVFEKNIGATSGQYPWKGINVIGVQEPLFGGNQIQMEYCIGRDAEHFLDLDIAYISPYNFLHCTFSDNYAAVFEANNGGVYDFDSCLFKNNHIGISDGNACRVKNCDFDGNDIGGTGIMLTENSLFRNHTQYGLFCYGTTKSCTFTDNKIGVIGVFNGVNNTFTHNTLTDNEIGVQMESFFNTPSIKFEYNSFCNNTLYNVKVVGYVNASNLANNCWCTTDSLAIEASIYDAKDDLNLALVSFTPFLTVCTDTSTNDTSTVTPPVVVTPISDSDDFTMSYSSDKIKVSDNADIPVFFVVVMDLNGNVLYQTDAVNPIKHTALDLNSVIYEKEATIDISTYPKGLYFVKVNNHRFKKLLKY